MQDFDGPRLFHNSFLSCLAALAVSCSQATPYQPESTSSAGRGRYSHEQIAPDQIRVGFHGNALTSRETVEAYQLYHAAEVTLRQGGDWFRIIDREPAFGEVTERGSGSIRPPDPPVLQGLLGKTRGVP